MVETLRLYQEAVGNMIQEFKRDSSLSLKNKSKISFEYGEPSRHRGRHTKSLQMLEEILQIFQ